MQLAVQSIGMALTEGLLFDDVGRLTNPSLLDYRKLTAADLPNLETIIVEVPAPAGPFGATMPPRSRTSWSRRTWWMSRM